MNHLYVWLFVVEALAAIGTVAALLFLGYEQFVLARERNRLRQRELTLAIHVPLRKELHEPLGRHRMWSGAGEKWRELKTIHPHLITELPARLVDSLDEFEMLEGHLGRLVPHYQTRTRKMVAPVAKNELGLEKAPHVSAIDFRVYLDAERLSESLDPFGMWMTNTPWSDPLEAVKEYRGAKDSEAEVIVDGLKRGGTSSVISLFAAVYKMLDNIPEAVELRRTHGRYVELRLDLISQIEAEIRRK